MIYSKNSFVKLVRKKDVKWPTERGFNEKSWAITWNRSSDNSNSDRSLYEAGLVFDKLLSKLRNRIADLYSAPSKASVTDLLKAYCGLSNRDRALISKPCTKRGVDLMALRSSANKIGNELSLLEIADGCVDAIEHAIRSKFNERLPISSAKGVIDAFDFVQEEIFVSQLYGIYEAYWHALVWGEYEFCEVNGINDAYEIKQLPTEFSISYESSQIRKTKLLAHSILFVKEGNLLRSLEQKNCLTWTRDGKRKKLTVKTAEKLNHEYQIANASFIYQHSLLFDEFPREFLEVDFAGEGYTVLDVCEIFRLLVVLAQIDLINFPHDDSVFTLKKAIKFCPVVSKNELARALNTATKFGFEKCSKIMEFLSFGEDREKDLWCYPLVNLDGKHITYLVSALTSPVLQRVVEHWLVNMKVPLGNP